MDTGTEEKLLAQSLLSAAKKRDLIGVRNLLRKVSANVQDATTGTTPLHAVVLGNEDATSSANLVRDDEQEQSVANIVQLLLEKGAIWNDLDKNQETPGCIAWRLGYKKAYKLLVDAGIRAELLLSKLDEIASDGEEVEVAVEKDEPSDPQSTDKRATELAGDPVAAQSEPAEDYVDHWNSNSEFLRSSLRYTDKELLDSSSNAVMMDWETEIMSRHAERILPRSGLSAMNIGHGMGIVDKAIQSHSPSKHHIVEAHPMVLEQMRKNGWYDKPNVIIHEGRWQDILPDLIKEGVELDGIYYDTFAEDYKDLKELFTEHVIGLLAEEGRFSFYNGLGADRRISYDVYTSVRQFHFDSDFTC